MDIVCLNNNICLKPCMSKFSPKLQARFAYVVFHAFCLIFAVIMGNLVALSKDAEDPQYDKSMYSMSFALTLFQALILILSLTGSTVTIALNKGLWAAKFAVVLLVYMICYGVGKSTDFLNGYSKFCWFVSLGLIIYMTLISISFGHFLNVRLFSNVEILQNAQMSSAKWQALLWILTVIFYIAFLSFYIDIFVNNLDSDRWGDSIGNKVHNVVNFCFALIGFLSLIAISVVSVSPIVERKRLLTSAYVSAYVGYMHWSAYFVNLSSIREGYRVFFDIVLGLVFLLASLLYLSLSSKKMKQITEEDKIMKNNPFIEYDDDTNDYKEGEGLDTLTTKEVNAEGEEVEVLKVTRSYFIYQGCLLFASIYYCVHMTNWDVLTKEKVGGKEKEVLEYNYGYWTKIVVSLIGELIYVWMLIAQKCCPDREFDF